MDLVISDIAISLTAEAKIRRLRQEIEELQVKVALYASRSRSLTEGNRVLDELSKRVAARSQKWKNALRLVTYLP